MSSPPPFPPSSPTGSNADILTPSRKVQALLARFDESDVEEDTPVTKPVVTRDIQPQEDEGGLQSETSGDEVPVLRKSRMAARLQGTDDGVQPVPSERQPQQPLVPQLPSRQDQGELSNSSQLSQNSDDELSRPAPRRRLLLKRKSSPAVASSPLQQPAEPLSPMFFPSPSASKHGPTSSPPRADSDSDDLPGNPLEPPRAKFLALVEKHRKQRMEKEAAEAAKREALANTVEDTDKPRKQRGSSPADGSDEDSDASAVSAAKKLSKETKSTRKASKKAVEEMKRETQRMSRNMQLEHQARTKKKVTKESLLARFNFSLPGVVAQAPAAASSSTVPSSDAGSDAELGDITTPPTSPPHDSMDGVAKLDALVTESGSAADGLVLEPPPLAELDLVAPVDSDKGKGKAIDWPLVSVSESVVTNTARTNVAQPDLTSTESLKADRMAKLRELLKRRKPVQEDDELEVVTARGDRRKYAAFERLPKRKATETSSHLALRSLAHLNDPEKNNKSKMNPAELDLSLRRAARMQAKEERQQKIQELRAKGVVIQTAEEREKDQQEVEDLVERARQEAVDIQKREKELAKKNGTYVKDGMDSDDSDDGDFDDFEEEAGSVDSDDDGESENEDVEDPEAPENDAGELIDDAADESDADEDDEATESAEDVEEGENPDQEEDDLPEFLPQRSRQSRIIIDDDDEAPKPAAFESPRGLIPAKTPQSLTRSARKQIPGLEMNDDLPIGLSQAFAATMADSQTQGEPQTQEQDSYDLIRELPSPGVALMPRLNRLESLDIVSNSQASETQPLNINLSFSQSQQVPESPLMMRGTPQPQFTPSQAPFEPTQDNGYMFSPFQGKRFDTPRHAPSSTVETVILPNEVDASPAVQRRGKLQRGRATALDSDEDELAAEPDKTAFAVMKRAAKKAEEHAFDKNKSNARDIVDEAAEESDDEYAGLGGASDDEHNDAENEDDRRMIDHDTQVGRGDEAKLAGLYADRERKSDEAAVSKLLKDITTGAFRRKRGVNDDLDLSDEEDAVSRKREAKRREFAKMRRELLKDEAVGKIAADKKKEAFLRSIEDREAISDDDDFDEAETPLDESQPQSQAPGENSPAEDSQDSARTGEKRKHPLDNTSESQLNRLPPSLRRTNPAKKPSTLAEIRDSVSFLIEEPDSQAAVVDLGLSDSDEEPEAYVNLDRHLQAAEADENADDDDDDGGLGDFIVDDDGNANDSQDIPTFKKPVIPTRANFTERRTRTNVVNRLNLLRQSSSSTSASSNSNSSTTKMAFYTSTSASNSNSSFKVPSLLRRATTNSSFSSIGSAGDNVSATGVTTSRTERNGGGGEGGKEKEFIRKGRGGMRNAVNYQGPTVGGRDKGRMTVREERMSQRAGVGKKGRNGVVGVGGGGKGKGFLGGLFGGGSWG